MKSKLITITLGLGLTGAILMPTPASEGGQNQCPIWAEKLQANTDDPAMHRRGCDDVTGEWEQVPTKCMQKAYNYALCNDGRAARNIDGCYLYEDGTWSNR